MIGPVEMPAFEFPDPQLTGPEGIVAVGGRLEPGILMAAYRQGIFPWPVEGLPMLWFCPPERGVLEFSDLHIGRTLERVRRRRRLRCSTDEAFSGVIEACAFTQRRGEEGTWITAEVRRAYKRLHRMGIAHSAEAWDGDLLVGGVYGVDVDGAFAAESMFYRQSGASQLALLHLIERLAAAGLDWLDIQVLSPHLERLGAKAINREVFLRRLQRTRTRGLQLLRNPTPRHTPS